MDNMITFNGTEYTKEELESYIKRLSLTMDEATNALNEYNARAECHRYESEEDAMGAIEDILCMEASEACNGRYNVGNDTYEQECYVGDKKYKVICTVEYNHHDKMYYVYGVETRIEPVTN